MDVDWIGIACHENVERAEKVYKLCDDSEQAMIGPSGVISALIILRRTSFSLELDANEELG
jgi:hypothetical protein